MAVLICGGAGYIGSHVNKLLSARGIETVVYDNLVYGHREAVRWGHFVQGDLNDMACLSAVFETYKIEAVLHFAAYAYVGESVAEPEKYYYNNIGCTLNLLQAMRRYGCDKIIFSSTCATYGEPESVPILETFRQDPVNPYGFTKLVVERILKDYEMAYGLKYVVLRYFNAAGADPEGEIGESHTPETHLIPLVLQAALGKRKSVSVFGTDYATRDGSCIRDYIHVSDLADAHWRALVYLLNEGGSDCFNLGNENGTSVLEVIQAVREITGKEFPVELRGGRPGDPAILVGSSEKIRERLGWIPLRPEINTIVKDAWEWEKNRRY